MPSQRRSAIFLMKARRSGVSTICAMFSRVGSATSGVACSSRKASTSATKACCSVVKSKSMGQLYRESDGSSDLGTSAVVTLGDAMDFTFSPEQQELREAVRALAIDRSSSAQVRSAMAADEPYDAGL